MYQQTLGIAVTGSFCTFKKTLETVENLSKENFKLIPILSYSTRDFDTRFFEAKAFREQLEHICKNKAITTIPEAEPIGPKGLLDALIIMPCTGNTLSKLSNGITDTPVTMAGKSHLRNLKPLIICVSTNDGLSSSLRNISVLYNKKNIYFVPFFQDDPIKKPNSLIADFDKTLSTLKFALDGKQIQPVLIQQ